MVQLPVGADAVGDAQSVLPESKVEFIGSRGNPWAPEDPWNPKLTPSVESQASSIRLGVDWNRLPDRPDTPDLPVGLAENPVDLPEDPLGTLNHPLGTLDSPLGTLDNPLGKLDNPLGKLNFTVDLAPNPLGKLDFLVLKSLIRVRLSRIGERIRSSPGWQPAIATP